MDVTTPRGRRSMQWSEVDAVLREAIPRADAGDEGAAWAALAALEARVDVDATAAHGLAIALAHPRLGREHRLQLAAKLLARWPEEPEVLAALGEATETLADLRFLNAAPPSDPLFGGVATGLEAALRGTAADAARRARLARGLATAARVCGRAWDEAGERAHRALLDLRPDGWQEHYNHGLFLKRRGRFSEAVDANRAAARLGGADDDSVVWNLGICATATGDGQTALDLWRRLGCELELGDDGLPAGTWDHVQVRLAQRPVAARTAAQDDPGAEETVWIERLSPCHGRVVSALYDDEVGVDYGDLVLFDGAPILSRQWGERTVPVFPHLVTLRKGGWRTFRFAATQNEPGQVAAVGERLGHGAFLYVHTEQVRVLCRSCWEREDPGHAHAEVPHPTVTGKLVVPPTMVLERVGDALGRATAGGPRVFVPGLWEVLGQGGRAEADRRRFEVIAGARGAAS